MPIPKIIKKKAWATVIPNWVGVSISDVFFYKEEAKTQAKINALHKKVIPVTISYSLPKGRSNNKK